MMRTALLALALLLTALPGLGRACDCDEHPAKGEQVASAPAQPSEDAAKATGDSARPAAEADAPAPDTATEGR